MILGILQAFRGVALLTLGCAAMTGCSHVPPEGMTLTEMLDTENPALILPWIIESGRTLDLTDQQEVKRLLGSSGLVQGRRGFSYVSTKYSISYGSTYSDKIDLIITPYTFCMPMSLVYEAIQDVDFGAVLRKATIAIYTDVPYRTRPRMAFTFLNFTGPCIQSFGLSFRLRYAA
jgi:hypothetical protein